jgi:hypothetical protein
MERLPFAVADLDFGLVSAIEVDRSDGRVIEPAVRSR